MKTDQLTFNDLPAVVGELCDRIASMENLLTEKLSKQHEAKENTHVPMTVQEACAYLKMPLSTFYYKVKKDDIPVIKQGKHLYIYRDELDKWLESSRKNPAPQTFEEENEAMLASHRRKPEEAPAVLMVDDAVIGTLGNFSASIGKAKSKKTFNVSAIAASALSGRTVLRYRSMFPENKRKILYIDTEQGRHHCQQVLKRILRLAEMPDDKVPENLIMLSLRKFAPRVRLLIVEEAIGTTPDLGLVIIDGIRDFLYDINSSSESTEVISKFMQWTDDKQIHIHTVLHQNKNDEHARGHIGTELNNKAETILQVEVDKEDKAISVVEAVHIRDRDFEPFAFRINEDVLPEPVEPYLSKEKKSGRPTKEPFDPEREIPEPVHRAAVDAAFANGNIGSYDDYLERLKEAYGLHNVKLGYNKAVKVATFLGNKQMVIKEGKNYILNPECHY